VNRYEGEIAGGCGLGREILLRQVGRGGFETRRLRRRFDLSGAVSRIRVSKPPFRFGQRAAFLQTLESLICRSKKHLIDFFFFPLVLYNFSCISFPLKAY
jgi:hypothetical protein